MESESDKARIEELEREVSQLRSRLQEPDETPASEPIADDRDALTPPPNWARIIATSAIIACIALGLMFAIFQAISVAIESMAPKAASMMVPDPGEAPAPAAPAKNPPASPQVPGL